LATVATATQNLPPLALQLCGAGVFLFGVLDLVFNTAGFARLHASLRRRYYELLAEAQRCPSQVPDKRLRELRAQLELIAADETPFAHGAHANAYNDAHLAMGVDRDSKDLMSMNCFERFTRNMLPYSSTWFLTVGEKEQRRKKR
jgi:hypothetical protein